MTETTPTAPDREALITETSRLAFEIEAAERNAPALARYGIRGPYQLRLRVAFHTKMAELLALTTAWCPEAHAKVQWARRDHQQLAQGYQRELDALQGVVL